MISDELTVHHSNRNIRILGTCWVVYGVIRLIGAVWLVSFSNTATMMFGALLNRVPHPFAMMDWFHVIYTLILVFSALCGILGVLAGWSLLDGRRFGRTLALVAGFLCLSDIPLGTTLGIYSLMVLLPLSARKSAVALEHQAADFRGHAA